MLSEQQVDNLMSKMMKHYMLTDLGESGGMHSAMASIHWSTEVADLMAVILELRAERDELQEAIDSAVAYQDLGGLEGYVDLPHCKLCQDTGWRESGQMNSLMNPPRMNLMPCTHGE